MRPIDADALKDAMYTETMLKDTDMQRWDSGCWIRYKLFENVLRKQPTIDAVPEWIPFKARELTDEEKEAHPEWDFIFDGKLPENGQRILVSIDIAGHERVQLDEFYDDDGIYLDSGYEIGEEAVAWAPLPNPYQEGSK